MGVMNRTGKMPGRGRASSRSGRFVKQPPAGGNRRTLALCLGLILGGQSLAGEIGPKMLPADLLPLVAERMAEGAPAFQPTVLPNGEYQASNPFQGLTAHFSAAGVAIDRDGESMRMVLDAFGRGDHSEPLGRVLPTQSGVRLTYRHGGLDHWFVNSPMGLEQVVTVNERPDGDGALRIGFALGGSLSPALRGDALVFTDDRGVVRLRYDRLTAVDARGRALDARMTLQDRRLTLAVNDADAVYPVVIDPLFSAEHRLTTGSSGAAQRFATAVAMDGTTVAVASPGNGTVYVYARQADGSWDQHIAAGNTGENFGAAIALTNDWLFVGAPGFSSGTGRVALYQRQVDGSWVWQRNFIASDAAPDDQFGSAIAVDTQTVTYSLLPGSPPITYLQHTLVVGAPYEDGGAANLTSAGSVYVYQYLPTGWTGEKVLRGTAADYRLGTAVDISRWRLIAGAPGAPVTDGGKTYTAAGLACLYEQQADGSWPKTATLYSSQGSYLTPETGAEFGTAVAIDGDLTLGGAPYEDVATMLLPKVDAGKVTAFTRQSDGSWTFKAVLKGDTAQDFFGSTIALNAGAAVIGAPGSDVAGDGAGKAQIYLRDAADTLTSKTTLTASDAVAGMGYGSTVALSGQNLVVGGQFTDAAYVTESQVDLSLVKTDMADPVIPHFPIAYQLTVTNNDPEMSATGVTVTDPLPPDVTFNSADPSCSESGGTVTCDLGTLAPGEYKSVPVLATAPAAATTVTNTATVTADQPIVTVANARDSEQTTVNTPPVISDQTLTTPEDSRLTVTLSASDADNDPLTFTHTDPQHGTLIGIGADLLYTPSPNFNGSDSFTFDVDDGHYHSSALVTITVSPVNDAPVPDPQAVTTDEDQAVPVALSATDVENDTLTYSVTAPPAHGTLSGTAPALVYTPAADFNGTDGFTFQVSDGSASNTAAVTLTVNPVNDAPVANAGSVATDEDTDVAVTLSASDPDSDPLTYTITTPPVHGTLHGTAPNLTYTPAADFNGTDSLTFQVSDGKLSATATVDITVRAVNDSPVPASPTLTTNEETAVTVTLSATDKENDTLTYTVTTQPAHGTLTGTAPNLVYTPEANYNGADAFTFGVSDGVASATGTVNVQVNAVNDAPVALAKNVSVAEDSAVAITLDGSDIDGDTLTYAIAGNPSHGTLSGSGRSVTYTPDANYNGTDAFTFTVSDGLLSSTATVSITVTAVNDLPVAIAAALVTDQDTPKSFTLGGSDADGGTLSFTVVTGPAHGSLSGTAPSLTYTPTSGYSGSDSFVYQVSDGVADSRATVTITVNPAAPENRVPVADAVAVTTTAGSAVATVLTGSDADGDALTFAVVAQPSHGSLSGTAPNLTYTPEQGFSGEDSFSYRVNDGTADSAPATVTITVAASNSSADPTPSEGGGGGGGGGAIDWLLLLGAVPMLIRRRRST